MRLSIDIGHGSCKIESIMRYVVEHEITGKRHAKVAVQ